MADNNSFTVPGFDFLQSLVKNAGSALPAIGQWVAPTLNPEELSKRIEELKTVQFWLEQNSRMIGATIQALEVQRMTLSTLKTMNVQMDDLRESLQIRMPTMPSPSPSPAAAPSPPDAPMPASGSNAADATAAAEKARPAAGAAPNAAGTTPGAVDPMQWWGALTKQFTELATTAMKESAGATAKNLAAAKARKGGPAAPEAAAQAPAKARRASRKVATKRATSPR